MGSFTLFAFGSAGLGDARECDMDIPSPQPIVRGAVHGAGPYSASFAPCQTPLEGSAARVLLFTELLELLEVSLL